MFHPEVVRRAEHAMLVESQRVGTPIPGGVFTRRSLDECWSMRDQLASAAPTAETKGQVARALTTQESTFLRDERMLCQLDYRYWSERWAVIAHETQEEAPLTPRWASQELLLSKIADLEYRNLQDGNPDGILVNCVKGRQLGVSTEFEAICAHRATTQRALKGLVAADVEAQAEHLFGMFETVVHHLPWWLLPPLGPYDTGSYWSATNGTSFRTAWGRSARGGLKDAGKTKGNIGRGRTYGCGHVSEISTWERPEQLDDALTPAIPRRRRVFFGWESTAKGRLDYWHTHWVNSGKGLTRFTNVFIPWYIEPDKYWMPVPSGWLAEATTLTHAEAVERDSPNWCNGRTVRLTKEQLVWYQHTRAGFAAKDELYKFLEEYCATPSEAFQYSGGRRIFTDGQLEACRGRERRPTTVLLVEPAKDIAQLKEWERQAVAAEARLSARPDPPTPLAPVEAPDA